MATKGISSLFSSSKPWPSSSSPSSSPSSSSTLSLPSPRTPLTRIRHTFSDALIDETIENARSAVTKWGPGDSALFLRSNRPESVEFLKSVDQLRHAMRVLAATNSASDRLVTAQNLMLAAMKILEKDFYRILSTNIGRLDPESVSTHYSSDSGNSLDGDGLMEAAMFDLKMIADSMVRSGYGRECVGIYKLVRKSAVDEGLYRLGIRSFRSSHVRKMHEAALGQAIKNWVDTVKTAVRSVFRGERILCDHVFAASDKIRESCFRDITREAAVDLFRLPEMVSKRKQPPHDRVLRLLELYDALWEIWPDIEAVFGFESTSSVRLQAIQSLVKLGGSAYGSISDYESAIEKDSSRTPAPGGGIHPLTQSAMDFVASLTSYSGVLSEILADHSKPDKFFLPKEEMPENVSSGSTTVSLCLTRIILVLLCKLDMKSRLYRDPSLSYLFLANNLNFVVQKVASTDLKYLLGDEWIARHEKKVGQFASRYEVFAWGPIFLSLPETGDSGSGSMTADAVNEQFGKFNAAFENAYVKQVSWVVPDGKLRDQIKVSIANKILPAYREFYELGMELVGDANRYSATAIRFVPDDIGNYLSDMFHGNSVVSSPSSSRHLKRRCVRQLINSA